MSNVHFLHVRACDYEGKIQGNGGLTIAYTANENLGGIFFHIAQCSWEDNFSYKTGRELSRERLEKLGPLDILDFAHPVSKQVRDWVMLNFADTPIGIIRDKRGRSLSTFDDFFIEAGFCSEEEVDEGALPVACQDCS